LISDRVLEIALKSAVQLLAGVVCQHLSLSRLALLSHPKSGEDENVVLNSRSFLIVDARTEQLPLIQPLLRRLKGQVACVGSVGKKMRAPGGKLFQIDPEAPLLELVESLRVWMDSPLADSKSKKLSKSPILCLGIRETQILELLAAGKRYIDIADTLRISVDTVRSHLRRIYPKLGVQSRTAAVSTYLRRRGYL